MSFDKRQNWLSRNQGRIAVAVAMAAIGAWGCQSVTPTASKTEDSVNLKNGGTTATGGNTAAKPGAAAQPGQTNPGTPATGGNGQAPVSALNPGTEPGTTAPAIPTNPGTTVKPGDVPTIAMNAAVDNTAPITWSHKAVMVDPAVAASFPKGGKATLVGKVVDEFGKPAANVPVLTNLQKTTTNAQGFYEIKVEAAPDAAVRFGGNANGYVPFDDFIGVFPDETLRYDTQVLSLDDNVTKIDVAKGGTATSSSLTKVLGELSVARPSANNPKETFGLLQAPSMGDSGLKAVYLEIPPGGLILPDGQTEATVTLTWLNPLPREGKPYGDLYGPLQTYTQWNATDASGTVTNASVAFNPVNFADLDIGDAKIAPGAELRVKWVVGPEVLSKYPVSFSGGQAFMPCYQYDTGEGWTKPVLATVFEENDFIWTSYTMRGSNPPPVVP